MGSPVVMGTPAPPGVLPGDPPGGFPRRGPHYTTLHHTTLHYTTLHYTTLHCSTLHYTTLHYTTLHYTTLHYTKLHYTTLHYAKLHYTTPHPTTPHYTTLHYTTLHYKGRGGWANGEGERGRRYGVAERDVGNGGKRVAERCCGEYRGGIPPKELSPGPPPQDKLIPP